MVDRSYLSHAELASHGANVPSDLKDMSTTLPDLNLNEEQTKPTRVRPKDDPRERAASKQSNLSGVMCEGIGVLPVS